MNELFKNCVEFPDHYLEFAASSCSVDYHWVTFCIRGYQLPIQDHLLHAPIILSSGFSETSDIPPLIRRCPSQVDILELEFHGSTLCGIRLVLRGVNKARILDNSSSNNPMTLSVFK